MRKAALKSLILGLGILLTRSSSPAGALPDLSGTWKLNAAQSDDPQQKVRETAPSAGGSGAPDDPGNAPPPSGGGGYGGGGGHHGGGHGGHGRRGDGGPSDGGASWLEARESLVIKHSDPELRITDAAGRERTLYTDGRKTEEERSLGGTTKVVALWKDGHIEVTSRPEKGPKVVQTYAVSADGAQLTVTTKVEGRRSVEFRSVYDAAREAAPAPAPSSGSGGDDDDIEVTAAGGVAR